MIDQWWPVLTPSALLGIAVLMVLTGRLIPRRTYEEKSHEAQEWRTESRIKDAQIAEKDEQLGHLREVGETVNEVMRSIKRKAATDDGEGSS
ncbi:hypothetical protein [Nocardioides terrisoli]|uniref:hypothetical protein n=1 Tax=Nocardioides terrisoli TaxID=3388267 RepID=UPI00287B8472|nr:hypothetical protein [Nocardioides marmorisolisilvae]